MFARFESMTRDSSLEEWRQLSHDLLARLVRKQGHVIALQRRAIATTLAGGKHGPDLRAAAELAFAEVQELNLLRRRVHTILAEKRAAVIRIELIADAA